MDERQERACVIRWLTHLVQTCRTCDAEMVADVLGYRSAGELQAKAQHIIKRAGGEGAVMDETCGTCRFFVVNEDWETVCDKSRTLVDEDTEACPRHTEVSE